MSSAVVFPAQPSTGKLERIPLGGDGFSAPEFCYALVQMAIAGAAGGGSWSLQATLDPRFCSLVAYLTVEIDQAVPAQKDVSYELRDMAGRTPPQGFNLAANSLSSSIGPPSIAHTWVPVPMVMGGGAIAPRIGTRGENFNSDTYFMSALIYCFDIRVREKTPMGPLLWARGAT